jgi:hypothetical protein
MDYQQTNWLHIWPIAQYAVNDAMSSTTGETPNFTVFGYEKETREQEDIEHERKIKTIHQNVKNELERTKMTQKKYYDRKRVEYGGLNRSSGHIVKYTIFT